MARWTATGDECAPTGPLLIEGPKATAAGRLPDHRPSSRCPNAPADEHRPRRSRRQCRAGSLPAYAPLAAAIAFAVALGAVAGAAATSGLMRDTSARRWPTPPAPCRTAWRSSAASLRAQGQLANAQRTTSTIRQARRTPRPHREGAGRARGQARQDPGQHRPARTPPAAWLPWRPRPTSPARSPRRRSRPKPQVAEGWRLRDFYDGRAVVESRNGTLFKVGPGSNVPGLGRVEAIKRENGGASWW